MDAFILPQRRNTNNQIELVPAPIPVRCLKFPRKYKVHPHEAVSESTKAYLKNGSSAFRRKSSHTASRRSCISLVERGTGNGQSNFGGLNFNSLKKNRNKVSCIVKSSDVNQQEQVSIKGTQSLEDLLSNNTNENLIYSNEETGRNSRRINLASSSPQLTNCDQSFRNPNNFFCVNNNNSSTNGQIGGNKPNGTSTASLGVTVNSNSGFKKFLIFTTIIYISLVICIPPGSLSLSCWAQGETILDESGSPTKNSYLIKNIWDKLTQDEIHSIFGKSHSDSPISKSVPNFDIIEPKVIHRKARGKRSFDSRTKNNINEEIFTQIKLEGLGKRFNLDILPNRNLLDPHFVFLTRNQNQSEIMPEEHVNAQLDCFYQGIAKYQPKGNKKHSSSSGSVALNLCGGVKGFILPSQNGDSDQHYHYVIHPVPDRLHNNSSEYDSKKPEHERQHFLFKRQNKLSYFSAHQNQHAKSSENNDHGDKNDNNNHGTCAHNRNTRTSQEDKPSYTLDTISHRMIKTDHDRSSNNYRDDNIYLYMDDNRSVNTLASHPSANRKRRSTEIFTNNDPFAAYGRPPTSSSDSYWLQYRSNLFNNPRSASSTAAFPSSYWKQKSSERNTNPFGDINRRRYGDDNASGNNDEYDHNASASSRGIHSRSDTFPWSKGVMYESTTSGEDDELDTILPFYTKGSRKRSSKINKSSWPSDGPVAYESSSSTSSLSLEKYNLPQENFTSSRDSDGKYFRKGRRDDNFFGRDWKSPIDSDIVYSEKKEKISSKQSRYEDLDSNSIYSSKPPIPNQLTIETAVFIDKDLFAHMKMNFPDDTHGEVVRIVLAMINAVQLLYHDPSLGHRVDFVLKRLEVLESDPPGLLRPFDIDRFLTNFCKWQKTENPPNDADPLHWDHALILTGLDLYVVHQSGKISNQVVGLAPVAGMCTRSSSCTVNEGRHFESVFVISHEIGHNLGMRHDGPQADNDCDPTSHIMSPTLGSGKITWSPCSRKYLDMFLETSQSKCLLDKAKSEIRLDHDADGRLPGERFDSDRQCVLKYGRGSFHATQQPLEDVCRDLHCRREHYTWTSHPALEGTYCGSDMLCRAGKCVRRTESFKSQFDNNNDNSQYIGSNHLAGSETAAYSSNKAVDGAWGKWSLFTDCSSACIYADDGKVTGSTGIRLAARRCDSPRSENGGRQCSGPDRRYKTCDTHKICSGNLARNTVSQYANEVCHRAASVDTELTGVGYMMNTNDAERACSVWCETLDNGVPRSRGWSFPDGTSCKLITHSEAQSYCVAGKCQEFGCNPYSHYGLSDGECSLTSSNEVTPTSSWYTGPSSISGSRGSSRNGKTGWTDWEPHSECKLPCLAPAKGLELVKRLCSEGDIHCSGLSLSVRLCKPDKSAIIRNGCTRLQTPFEYSTKVCSKYAEKITGLSGIGMQLSPTKDDNDRPCRIGCQDASIPYRFYMVNGEDGWFPAGTDCSRGDPDKKAYCIAGKCVDFGNDDTPVYRINSKLMGRIETLFQRNKRQASYNIMEPLNVAPSLDQSSLRDLVHKFSQQTGNFPSIETKRFGNSVDFNRPVLIQRSSAEYSPISRGSSTYGSSYYNNNYNSRDNQRHEDNYQQYQPSVNYKQPLPVKNYHREKARGRSLSMDHVDVGSADLFSPNGQSRMLPSTQASNNYNHIWGGPVEGSYYEWRKIVSDCSVSCGSGIQEIIVNCISGDTIVSPDLCKGRPRPGFSGYADCHRSKCHLNERTDRQGQSSHIWNWLQSILPKNASHNSATNNYYPNA